MMSITYSNAEGGDEEHALNCVRVKALTEWKHLGGVDQTNDETLRGR